MGFVRGAFGLLKLALVQMAVGSDISKNLERAREMVTKAVSMGANVVALPEMFICPYETALFPKVAELEGGEIWKSLSEIAKQEQIFLIGGSVPERDEQGFIYNTCYVFNMNGEQVGKHQKVHLFDINIHLGQQFKESDTLTAGKDLCLVDTPFGKIGIMICFDIRFGEWARLLADAGADLIVVPGAFNMTTGPKHWELLMRARAVDNQLFVAAVSPARSTGAGYVAYGNSLIADPWGEVLHRLDEKEGILISEIDFEVNDRVRAQLPVLSARRQDLYALNIKK